MSYENSSEFQSQKINQYSDLSPAEQCRQRLVGLINHRTRPLIMGVLNFTPDSFSDGGRFKSLDEALTAAQAMLEQGADIIDIGGESTRPGAEEVSVDEELQRVMPLIQACVKAQIPVSVDTQKTQVMRESLLAGVAMINDVNGFRAPGALDLLAEIVEKPLLCVMHMQGTPQKMQDHPHYDDIFQEIQLFFQERILALSQCNVSSERIILDPGFGFGKTDDHNWSLLANLASLRALGLPVLVGLSRKSMLGRLLNRNSSDRLAASLAGALLAVQQGARIIRVHDVPETYDVLRVFERAHQSDIAKQLDSF